MGMGASIVRGRGKERRYLIISIIIILMMSYSLDKDKSNTLTHDELMNLVDSSFAYFSKVIDRIE